MSIMERAARRFVAIKAARQLKGGIDKVGLNNLKALAENGKSILEIYLSQYSDQEKEKIGRELNAFLKMGVTADMIQEELIKQVPELKDIIKGKEGYLKSELEKLQSLVKES